MKKKIRIKKSELEKLSKEDLYAIAVKAQRHKQAKQFSKLDDYLTTAHEGQIAFHKAKQRLRMMLGGNRVGKSVAGVIECLWHLKGTHPFRRNKIPCDGVIVLSDYQNQLKNVFWPKLQEWCPPGFIERVENMATGLPSKIFFKNGSTLQFRSWESDPMSLESFSCDFALFDEPPPKKVFVAIWRGLVDRGGDAMITATPLAEPWLSELYERTHKEPHLYWAIMCHMKMNAKNLGDGDEKKGLERIKEFEAMLDDDERQARIEGKFLHLQGRIFKNWRRDHHIIEPWAWPYDWPIVISVDPHPRKDWAVSFVGITKNGTKILLSSELVSGVVEEIAEHIIYRANKIELTENVRPWIMEGLIDNYACVESMIKSARGQDSNRGVRIIDELNDYIRPALGINFRPAPKNVMQKIDIFKKWLNIKDTKVGPRAEFYVFDLPENKQFLWEIENYIWDRKRGRSGGYKDRPVKEDDDCVDSVLQVALADPSFGRNKQPIVYSPHNKLKGIFDGRKGHGESISTGPIIKIGRY